MPIPEVFYRLSLEALSMFKQDLENIRSGRYNLPWDMDVRHRQFRPRFVLGKAATYLRESSRVLDRRSSGEPDKVWLSSNLIPEYYQATWHYQTDGWLSSRSARAYDALTETLFVGRQDAMQRATIPPLKEHFAGRDTAGARVLEAACGTGRVATFIRDNLPGCHVTALDLSPFYLEEAREINREWCGVAAAVQCCCAPSTASPSLKKTPRPARPPAGSACAATAPGWPPSSWRLSRRCPSPTVTLTPSPASISSTSCRRRRAPAATRRSCV